MAYMMHANKGVLPAGMGGMALTPSQQSASLELAKSLNELKLVWDSLGNILVASVAPNLKTVADALSKMLLYLSMSSKLPNNFGGVGTIGTGIAVGGMGTIGMGIGLFSQLPRGASAVTNNVTNYINGVNDPEEIYKMITDSFFEMEPNQP
ncbi:MAG: hypothetical protein EBY17_30150 [Acidobacteriia bacterium]|nr:hypothetical protein [Terriglobia bacterium]